MKHYWTYFFTVVIIVLLVGWCTSCSPLTTKQKTQNKYAKKLKKWKAKDPEAFEDLTVVIVKLDTVIEKVEVAGRLRIDTLEVENLVKEFIHDTVRVTEFINRFLKETRDSVAIDTLGIHLRLSGTNIDYSLLRDSIHIEKSQAVDTISIPETTVVRKNFWNDWKLYVILLLALGGKLFGGRIKEGYQKYKPW